MEQPFTSIRLLHNLKIFYLIYFSYGGMSYPMLELTILSRFESTNIQWYKTQLYFGVLAN